MFDTGRDHMVEFAIVYHKEIRKRTSAVWFLFPFPLGQPLGLGEGRFRDVQGAVAPQTFDDF